MKRRFKYFAGIFALCLSSAVEAQSPIEKMFVSMPDAYYLSLSSEMRNKMLSAYISDSTSTMKNRFRGESSIQLLDREQQLVVVKNSAQGTVEIKALQRNDSIVQIAVIFTACAPACDSHIGFFGSNWQILAHTLMPSPAITDFLNTEKILADGKQVNDIVERFDIIFLQATFAGQGNNIEVTLNSKKFLEKEQYEALKPYLKGSKLLYEWRNNAFEKSSCYW
ncbi:MAG: DUF3256 family protein [Prevotellaceae bacterium]|jgi:hypothetical protein|nr:DUF3256 family protein [Prevotellaceae bacterium]